MKKNTAAVKLLFVVLFVLSAVSIVSAQNISVYELDDEDLEKFLYLGDQLYSSSVAQNMQDIYTEMQWTPVYDSYPEKFDLRENGTVPPVRDQSPWDNLPIKGYVYPLAAVLDFHALDQCIYAEDGQTQVCVPGFEE